MSSVLKSFGRKNNTTNLVFALLVSFFLSTAVGYAQNISNYVFATANDGSLEDISVGNTTYLEGNKDDAAGLVQPLGFDFIFMGSKYSHFSANSNGQMRLHSSGTETAIGTNVTTAVNAAILAPFTGDNEVGNGMRFKTIGTSPNRTFILEWNQFYVNYLNLSNAGNMQVWLEETTGKITYIYGEIYNSSTSSQTRSISIASSNTATTVGSVTIGNPSTFSAGTTLVSNTIAAGANPVGAPLIANIGSAANGNRTYFTFTPTSVVLGDVANLSFSAITSTGATLNWDDNATNEVAFLVTRATDAAFTQNVANFSVPSTSSGTSGTAYNLVQSSLSAGTTFYYKVVATVEGGSSTGLVGNTSTLAGATYYWTGATGENWNTFSNWNTAADATGTAPAAWDNSDVYVIDGEGTVPGGALSISVDRPTFTIGQIKIINNTNLTLASSATTTRTISISGGPGDDFILEAGSTLNLVNATNAIIFNYLAGTGNTGLIAGTYVAGGSTSNLFNVTNSAGTLVSGTVTNNILGVTGCLTGSLSSLTFAANSNYSHTAYTTGNGYIPLATWDVLSTATLTGGTTGTGLTSASPSLGNLVINTSGLTSTINAFAANTRTIQGNLVINNTGTGRFRAVSSGLLTVNGNILVNGGIFDISGSSTGRVLAKGDIIIASGGTLDINQGLIQAEANIVNNGAILSSETTTANSRLNFVGTTGPQTLSGTGSFSGRISSLSLLNEQGLVLSSPVLTQRVNLFSGTISGSSNITIGTGLALAAAVQIGSDTNTTPGGNFDAAPIFNLGTGAYSILYAGETTSRDTGFEVPASRIVTNILVNNANGLTLIGGNLTTTSSLTLTNGVVNTGTNILTLGNETTVGTLTGGSDTSYVNGALTRSIVSGNTNSTFVPFPIGKSGIYTPIAIAPATTSIALFKAESFGSNTGTQDPSIIGMSTTRRFEALPVSGTFDDINVRLSDAGIVATNIPVQAASASGAYIATFGSTALFASGTPNSITSTSPVSSSNYTGFLSYADSNACSGTPNPGNTIASANSICLGTTVLLSLQNITTGSGVTYQWQSSPDGVSYTDILDATANTYSVVLSAPTYFRCNVTCAASALTGTSAPVEVTFSNSIVSTTPATRCGVGSVTLGATPSAGASINWYANAAGGVPLASGNSFVTPSIAATTTYYASASTASAGNVTIGTGTGLTSSTSQNGIFCNYWATGWRQMVYTASELAAAGLSAGNITSLTFNIATLPSPATVNNFAIRLGATTNSTLTSFTTTGLNSVFGPVNYTPVVGLNTITLTTPYLWDGVSNILIDIREDGQYASANSQTYVTTTATNTVVHGFSSGSALNPAYYTSNPAATASNTRPNVVFGGQVACSSGRVAVVAEVTTPPALTLSATTVTTCTNTSSSAITITSNAADYDTYTWSPLDGVSGNAAIGWVFNPTMTTTYTLTASQSTGSLCSTTATVAVTVNPIPSAITVTQSPAAICTNQISTLSVTGGTLGAQGKIGAGVATNTTSTPFRAFYGGQKTQALYTASELTALGMQAGQSISSIGYVALSGTPVVLNNFSINAGFVSASSLGTSFIAGATNVVVAPSAYTAPTGVGNLDYTVSTPLVWDGTSNLLVETCFNNNNGGASSTNSISVESSTVASGLNIYYAADSTPAVCSNATGLNSTNRPNLRITAQAPTTITWSPVTNLFSDAAATTAYVEGTPATTVYYKSSTAGATTFTVTATTAANCSVTATTTVDVIDCGIPYANLQFPGMLTTGTCVSPTYYARVYKGGVTEAPGQGSGIQAWIGRNASNTDPATWSEDIWQLATFNVQSGNDDEYQVTFAPAAAGTYYVASRFVFAPGSFVYGGYEAPPSGGGIWNGTTNVSGILTIEETIAPTASAQTFCNSATVADLVATGSDLQWYDTPTGGTALAGTTALATGDYYVSQTAFNCEGPRTMVSVTVNVTAAPEASAQTFCNSATVADLVATGTAVQWYTAATGGAALASTTALTTGDYYVSQTLNNCESPRTMVSVTVNVTAAPTASAQTFCNSATVADLVATGTALQWYTAATGGTALASTTALATGDYYVSQTLNNCESPRTMVAVTVNVTSAPTASAQTFCNSATVADLVATGTALQWYTAATGGTALASTTALATGDYYVSQTVTGCESPRTMVAVTVNPLVTPTFEAVAPICSGGTLGALPTSSTNGITGTWSPAINNTATTTYTFTPDAGQCASTATTTIVVNTTAAPTGTATQDFTLGQTLADFTVTGQNIIWYSSATGSTVLPSSTLIVSGVTYYASQTVNGCESVNRLAVTAGVDLKTPGFEIRNLRYYPNPVSSVLTVEYSDTIQGVQMYNVLGQLVYNKITNDTKVTVEMSGMPAGNYILQVTANGITKNVKVIKN